MHQNPNSTNNPGTEANKNKSYTVCSQPWWHGIGHDGFSRDMLGETMTDIIAAEQRATGDSGSKTSKSQVKGGPDEGTEVNKETQVIALSQSDRKFGEQHPQQYTASIVHQPVGEYIMPPTQLELVGHNIACASYSFSDAYYGGVVPAYGPKALVHPHCVGVHQARMALPPEMAEEPVYVNAKQYHGILRRRQIRAKAELEKKLIKVRKPYLHESRHLHAMRRARGCGGRFLNTKKVDAHASSASHDNGTNSTVTVSTHPTDSTSSGSMFPRRGDSSISQMQPQHTYSDSNGNSNSNGNGCYPQLQGFQLFRYNPLSDDSVKQGDFSGKKSERIVVNGAQNRALTIK